MNIDIRQAWLDFYQSKGYKKIDSAPLVHPAFPTSFNMSAGLVQLDPRIRMPTKSNPLKECLVQKCVRYFDINRVGDNNHLSFFEMAGAFEVVEINIEQTILNVWEFLTAKLQINPLNLWITMFDKDIVVDKEISLSDDLSLSLSLSARW